MWWSKAPLHILCFTLLLTCKAEPEPSDEADTTPSKIAPGHAATLKSVKIAQTAEEFFENLVNNRTEVGMRQDSDSTYSVTQFYPSWMQQRRQLIFFSNAAVMQGLPPHANPPAILNLKNIPNIPGLMLSRNVPLPAVVQPMLPTVPPTVLPTVASPQVLNSDRTSCGANKNCVKRNQCIDGKVNIYGSNIISLRDGGACGYLEVCCEIPQIDTSPLEVVSEVSEPFVGCGYRNTDGVGFRIMDNEDNEAEFGEFPWMVAILRRDDAVYECGGAILAPTVVLTAAHCVRNRRANALLIRAGEWDTQTTDEILTHSDRDVSEIITHANYRRGTLYNDIALLMLAAPLTWRANIAPICLPEANQNFDYASCFASGWGKNNFGKNGTYQVILKKIELPVVPRSSCEANLRNTRLGNRFRLHESFICAGGEKGKDTCKGDGGSPLVCPIAGTNNRYIIAGLVSWGLDCGAENEPGVYVNVPYLRKWIDDKLRANNIDFGYFTTD